MKLFDLFLKKNKNIFDSLSFTFVNEFHKIKLWVIVAFYGLKLWNALLCTMLTPYSILFFLLFLYICVHVSVYYIWKFELKFFLKIFNRKEMFFATFFLFVVSLIIVLNYDTFVEAYVMFYYGEMSIDLYTLESGRPSNGWGFNTSGYNGSNGPSGPSGPNGPNGPGNPSGIEAAMGGANSNNQDQIGADNSSRCMEPEIKFERVQTVKGVDGKIYNQTVDIRDSDMKNRIDNFYKEKTNTFERKEAFNTELRKMEDREKQRREFNERLAGFTGDIFRRNNR